MVTVGQWRCYNYRVSKRPKPPAQIVRETGLKRTPLRIGVLELLLHDKQPLSAPQILAKLPKRTDKVTLYRTLKTFTQRKLLHRVRGDDQVWRYGLGELNAPRHQHAHFVCDGCGTVECMSETPAPRKSAPRSKVRRGYRIAYSEVLLHGTCPDCR